MLRVIILSRSRDTRHSARPPNPFRQPWSGWVLMRSCSAVGRVGTSESAGRPEGGFACGGPEREIRHARQCVELHVIDGPETMHYRVKQGAQDARACDFELSPKLGFRTPVTVCNGR